MLIIDALQYSNWSRAVFEQMHRGRLSAAHVTIAYHETCIETLRNIGAWNRRFEQHGDLIMRANSAADVEAAAAAGKTGIIFGFQNCSPIEDDHQLVEIFHALGVRFMQLTYNNQSPLATGCYEARDSGVTRFGKQIISEMNRVGMVIDMSHSAERSTLEAMEISTRPIAITHANPSNFTPARRNKSDNLLRALGESGGMLGLSLYPFHLKDGSHCKLADFCEMAARTAELMGAEHIGIGSDLCQHQPDSVVSWMRNGRWSKGAEYGEGSADNAGWPPQPAWFGSCEDYGNLAAGLEKAGFSGLDLRGIMGENWLRFFGGAFGPA
ncbi:MAG: dipeptidase [Gammaproteobacteria bacterium]